MFNNSEFDDRAPPNWRIGVIIVLAFTVFVGFSARYAPEHVDYLSCPEIRNSAAFDLDC